MWFGCYLLFSCSPRFPGSTYIGFTVNPKRRIRQHNRCIAGGAYRTKWRGPWAMAAVVHGFTTKRVALQFEWHWQHPKRSLTLKHQLSECKYKRGPRHQMSLLHLLLRSEPFNAQPLSVRFHSTDVMMMFQAAGPPLPPAIGLSIGPVSEWDIASDAGDDTEGEEEPSDAASAPGSDTGTAMSDDGADAGGESLEPSPAVASGRPPLEVIDLLDNSVISLTSGDSPPKSSRRPEVPVIVLSSDDED